MRLRYARRVVRDTPSPSIARWSNALEYAVPISVVPIAGSVLGVYQAVLDAVG
ncbi:hypothetical protein GCM10010185_71370 [Saccharothrix coeruleofusca]|uniref:EccD-like transmembrane domain-containing protein n=1 Tax=Saccharothrix coeruleofusca TaxID=33919 RepID=A0A918EIR2_9PSEU|nr:hypothetical protein [Saccharothrix coeruleofusca]GGP87465.1 hypothetical protein GCM10010185_71370 [Saccharothrix coeruleofusca]